jgi:hypothetical protein
MKRPLSKVRKENGLWKAWSLHYGYLGASSSWGIALALALGEPIHVADGVYRSGSLNGVQMTVKT